MIGTTLGPYQIDRELGAGGMGKVYAATVVDRCPGLAEGTRVALKVLHPHLFDAPGFFPRFQREAQIGMSVVHENVVRTFGADQLLVGGVPYSFLTMELVEGQTLRELLQELDRVPEELCRHIGREIAKGLAAIHAAGVVHRDMKPENVLITREHVVKVMDLGVARLSDEALRLSQTGTFAGSIHYAAPECFSDDGREVDERTDLHAAGLVLYELSCGSNPYFADDLPQILKRILHEEPRRLGDVNPQLSPFFEEVVHCLLAKKPPDRFADATTLLGVLEEGEKSAWWKARSVAMRAVTHQPLRRIRIPRETAVYGREGEIARLRALFGLAKAGEGQVVVIEGEAGIGKSRIVDELVGRLQRDGETLNFLFGSYPPGGAATAAGAFSTAFREQLGEAGAGALLGQTPVLVAAFDALLRGETTPTGVEPLTRESLQTCFVHVTRNLAAERTTVLLIDDLHFAPDEALSLFTSLAMAVPGHRVLLVGTMRPGIDPKWLAGLTRLPQTSQLTLPRLGPKDLAQLLRDSLRSETLALSLAGRIGLKSDGNPFFVFEIIRGLREGQLISQKADGTWVSTRAIDDIKIPSSVLDLVNARVADLSEEERELLDVAACAGFEFDATLVSDGLGRARIPTLRQLALVEKKHRLVRCAGERFVFDHHQVQEALYGALPPQLAREYHAALALALEARAGAARADPSTLDGALCVDLCEHFLKGGQGERARRYLSAALTHLEKGYLNDAAIRLAERALAVPGLLVGTERAGTLLFLCGPLGLLGRPTRQEEVAREAERLADAAGDDGLRGRSAVALGGLLWSTSRYAEAESSYRRALEIARGSEDGTGEAGAENGLGNVFRDQGRLAEASAHLERALALFRGIGNPTGEAGARINLGNVLGSGGHLREAREHLEQAIASCRETGHRQFEANATGSLGVVFYSEGRLAAARDHYERALAICREIGNRRGEALATANLGNVFRDQGRFAQAHDLYERGIAICREIGNRAVESRTTRSLISVFLSQGRLAEARTHAEWALATFREIGDRRGEGDAIQWLGTLADEEGDAASALRSADEALALRRAIDHGEGIAGSLLEVGDLRRRAGELDAARTALTEGLSVARDRELAPEVALALAMLACLPGGNAAAAITALEAAVEDDASPRTRWLLWQATGDAAHLTEAKRILDELLAMNPDRRESMLANVRVNREIAEAAEKDVAG